MSKRKVKCEVGDSCVIGNVRYNSGEQEVEFDHAVTLFMLRGATKAEAVSKAEKNLVNPEKAEATKEETKEPASQGDEGSADSEETETKDKGEGTTDTRSEEEESKSEDADPVADFANGNVDDIEDSLGEIEDVEFLENALKYEQENKDRKSAKEAIGSRIADLKELSASEG